MRRGSRCQKHAGDDDLTAVNDAHGDLRKTSLRRLVAIVSDDWETISAEAATYLYALDAHDCEVLTDPVGNETAELRSK